MRIRTTSTPACRTTAAGAARARSADAAASPTWTGSASAAATASTPGSTDRLNIIYLRVAGRQHDRYDLRTATDEHPAERRRGGRGGSGGRRSRSRRGQQPPRRGGGAPGAAGGGGRWRWRRRRRGGAPNVINAMAGEQYRFNWNTPFDLSPHNPTSSISAATGCSSPYNRATRWVASADLTKQVDRNRSTMMGVAGQQDAAVEERRRRRRTARSSRSPSRR